MELEYNNIFEAITDDKAQASDYQTRSDLMIAIRSIITEKKWSQAVAATKMGLTQPRVSDLVNGRVEKFSIDKLMSCLFQIGFRFKPAFENNQLTMSVEFLKSDISDLEKSSGSEAKTILGNCNSAFKMKTK